MTEKMTIADVEKGLVDNSFSTEDLKALAGRISGLGGFDPDDIFPLGIVNPDRIRARYRVKPTDLAAMITGMSGDTSLPVSKWKVFPLGIVAPKEFLLEVDIGNRLSGD